jgi:hypothetical protein
MSISESKIKQIIREETKRIIRESNIKGGTFVPRHGVDISGVKPGDRVPASWFDEPSMSPEEGSGARAAMRMREPKIRSVGNPDYLANLRIDDDSDGDPQEDWDGRKPSFMNRTSVDRDEPDMGTERGGGDSEADVDPDTLSDDPFYSGGHRVKEQKNLNIRKTSKIEKKIKESDNDTFEPHDFSGNKRMRFSNLTKRFEPLDIDSSGEDRPMHDPDVDYETGEVNRKRGSGDSMGSDMSESGRATFRKIVKEETLKFLRNRR